MCMANLVCDTSLGRQVVEALEAHWTKLACVKDNERCYIRNG